MAGQRSISLEETVFEIGESRLLGPLSLDIRERRLGVMGCNGAGKSTMLRLLAGLERPTRGSVSVHGRDPARERRWAVDAIGMIFQSPERQIIFPTVEEELAFGLTQQGRDKRDARRRVRACLKAHDRSDWAGKSCHSLSQGQKHYLCLLAVLLMEPDVLLLDEPFSGLDLPTTLWLREELQHVGQQTILATHDPALLATCARVIWLDSGVIVADGPPGEVLPAYEFEMREAATRRSGDRTSAGGGASC